MRSNWLGSLILIAVIALIGMVLLPLLGVLLLVVVGALVAGVGFFLLAPYLAKLPWFRDRIHVRQRGSFRSVHFGRSDFTGYSATERPYQEPAGGRLDHTDVIDVEGRELPTKKEDE